MSSLRKALYLSPTSARFTLPSLWCTKTVPMQCGHCGSTHLVTTGLGTEQLEETLKARFPQYNIARIDRDSTARKGKFEGYLEDIQQGKSQILIGTQMLAKGHHFPNVTLVALVNVDNALFSLISEPKNVWLSFIVQVAGTLRQGGKTGRSGFADALSGSPVINHLYLKGLSSLCRRNLEVAA